MSKIRVLHLITRLISGGADENTIYNVEGLDPERYEVHLAAGGPSEPDVVRRLRNATFVSVPHLQRELRPVKDVLAFVETVRLIKNGRYQLVHTHEAKAGVIGRFAAWYCRVPVVIHTLHGITFHRHLRSPYRYLYLALERLAAKCTDVFICVGEDLRSTYIRSRVGKPEQYAVVRSGFDQAPFFEAGENKGRHRRTLRERLGIPLQAPVVGTAARLEPRKGVQYFIEAAERIAKVHPDVHFTIAGRGEYQPELMRLVHQKGLKGRVHFLGHINQIHTYLAALDIFVLSSLWEGLPRAIVQARSVGVPVIGFEVEGIREVVRDGLNGYVVPSKAVDALAEKIDSLLRDPSRLSRFASYDDRHHLLQWDYHTMVAQIREIYEKMLGGIRNSHSLPLPESSQSGNGSRYTRRPESGIST